MKWFKEPCLLCGHPIEIGGPPHAPSCPMVAVGLSAAEHPKPEEKTTNGWYITHTELIFDHDEPIEVKGQKVS